MISRFIPAGAGNTKILIVLKRALAVYPRWRGEHPQNRTFSCTFCGLSPLARGTLFAPFGAFMLDRFIPAGAGNTNLILRRALPPPVYPRWRGEHNTPIKNIIASDGLSPLARGTRCYNTERQ